MCLSQGEIKKTGAETPPPVQVNLWTVVILAFFMPLILSANLQKEKGKANLSKPECGSSYSSEIGTCDVSIFRRLA